MGFGVLNVWVHDKTTPCKISDDFWFVNVTYCSGEILEYCGKSFGGLDAKCGHCEIELPPGCYVVQSFSWPIIRLSHPAVVMVECDQRACVHIYVPTDRYWIHQAGEIGQILANQEDVPREKAQRLTEAANSQLEHLPKASHDEALERMAKEAATRRKRRGK